MRKNKKDEPKEVATVKLPELSKEEFKALIDAKTPLEHLNSVTEQSVKLWQSILIYSLKQNEIDDTQQVDRLGVHCTCIDVSLGIMRLLKFYLTAQGMHLEAFVKAKTGKSPSFVNLLNKAIKISSVKDLLKQVNRDKDKQTQYVA